MQKLLLVYYHPQAKSGKYFQIWFSPDLGGKNGGVLSMRMQVILDSSFVRPGSAPIWGGKKGESRDWTRPWDDLTGSGSKITQIMVDQRKRWIRDQRRTRVVLLAPFMHNDLSDLGSLILIQITPKERSAKADIATKCLKCTLAVISLITET